MAIYDYLPQFNYIEPNNLKGLQPGFVVSYVEKVAEGLLKRKSTVGEPFEVFSANDTFFLENGAIAKITHDGKCFKAEVADDNTTGPLFIHFSEPLHTLIKSDNRFAIEFENIEAEYVVKGECPRFVQLMPGDEWMSTNPNCAIDGRIVLIDNESVARKDWYGVKTMANGDAGYHYVFLG